MPALRVNHRAVVHESVDGDVVAVNLETGCYFSMLDAAVLCWTAIARTVTEEELAQLVARRFGIALAQARADVGRFVADLLREGLVVADAVEGGRPAEAEETPGPAGSPYRPPVFRKFEDMRDLLLLDPIHDVDESGWPVARPDAPAS